MAEVRLRACDVCGKHEGMPKVKILKVAIEVGEERARAELCEDDAAPLLEVMKKIPSGSRRRGVRHDFTASMVDDPAAIPRDGNGPH